MKVNKKNLYSSAVEMNDEERALATDLRNNRVLYKASMRIAMKIKRALRLAGKTQKQLALDMNIDPATMSRYLSGKANMELKTLLRFEDMLGINIIDRSISPQSNERGEAKAVRAPHDTFYLINRCASFNYIPHYQGSGEGEDIACYSSSSPMIAEDPETLYSSR